jgi:hypothetical protein
MDPDQDPILGVQPVDTNRKLCGRNLSKNVFGAL